jgi:hypothetical protein
MTKKRNLSWTFRTLKTRPLRCVETSGNNYPVTLCHIPEQWIPQLHHCFTRAVLTDETKQHTTSIISVQHTIISVQHTIISVQHTIISVQHTIISVQHTIISVQHNYISPTHYHISPTHYPISPTHYHISPTQLYQSNTLSYQSNTTTYSYMLHVSDLIIHQQAKY